ncbi:MAG: carboxypeptidase regulatory-like domain-containing protein [Methylobacteriaceae bacterium]|nr:carboxypeptidase regulatory-like domain-containing protein [Methylobacteriaceae bacterium]
MRSHVSGLIGFVAAALAASSALAQEPAFDPKAAAFIHKEGKATIEGHAFMRRPDNAVENAVGQTIRLIPVTPYSEARFAQFYKGKKFMPAWQIPKIEADPEYASYTRTTTSDSNGRFTFENVAPGKYYVTTQIMWRPKGNLFSEGGAIYDIVTVPNKETKKVKFILTGP